MTTRTPSTGVDADTTVDSRPAAVRIPLPPGPELDPFALAGGSGIVVASGDRVLVGLGRALTLDLPGGLDDAVGVDAAMAALAAVDCDDRLGVEHSGHAVVAFGALPFDCGAPATLVVPELTFGREVDGTEWITQVIADGSGLPDPDDPSTAGSLRERLVDRAAAHNVGDLVSLRPVVEPRTGDDDFERAVATAVDAIHGGELVKVVLSRTVDIRLDSEPDIPGLLRRWTDLEPSCTVFSVPTADGQFVGASPELLVERTGANVRSRPLAGTTDRYHEADSGLPAVLLDSVKDGEEHRLVVDAIRHGLAPLTTDLHVPDRPELVHLHTITHLGTAVDGTLAAGPDGSLPSALHLVARLHPTPAVGGVPREAATALIRRLEPTGRGAYAGPVGYVDATGDGRWMIGIRAMSVDGSNVSMTAGVGIVAGSDPETERIETRLKLRAVFAALAPGVDFDTAAPTG
jgi:menaquinone-specific isochorismate synthase